MEVLLDNGALVNALNNAGSTPFFLKDFTRHPVWCVGGEHHKRKRYSDFPSGGFD